MKVTRVTSGRQWVQDMGGYPDGTWSGDAHLIWTEAVAGGEIEIEFTVAKAGRQELAAVFTKAVDYGIFELSMDGRKIERQFDFYDAKVTTSGEISLGTFDLTAGKHTLLAKAVGKNPQVRAQTTGAHLFGLDYVRAKEPAAP